ncbi:MAG: hypothetical protein Q8P20_03845, partial [bacterium]|nr:hypothetical protein [bacterium]
MLITKKIINTFNKVFLVNNKPVFKLVFVYAIAHFLLLLNRTVIHDGWFIYPLVLFKKYDILWTLYHDYAKLYNYYYILKFLSFANDPLFTLKVIAFFSWLISGVCIYYILRDFVLKSKRDVFIISLLYLLSPVLFTRFEISIVHYSVGNALFFSGALIYLK